MIIQFFNNNLTNENVLLVKYFLSRLDGVVGLKILTFSCTVLKLVSGFRMIIILRLSLFKIRVKEKVFQLSNKNLS